MLNILHPVTYWHVNGYTRRFHTQHFAPPTAERYRKYHEKKQRCDRWSPDCLRLDLEKPAYLLNIETPQANPVDPPDHRASPRRKPALPSGITLYKGGVRVFAPGRYGLGLIDHGGATRPKRHGMQAAASRHEFKTQVVSWEGARSYFYKRCARRLAV